MTEVDLEQVVHHVRGLLGPGGATPADRELLAAFARRHDQAAFAELVARHGPMVLAVCRRLIGDAHEADDAFQATWLVLARKAGAVRWGECVAGWLHAVAHRVARKARALASRRHRHHRELPMPSAATAPDADDDRHELLHAELARLPDEYREPLVLCYLQGRTNEQAARALGCPPGSMSRRLGRARDLLRRRLEARGAAVPAGGVVALLGQTAPVAVPAPLAQTTLHAAALVAAGQSATAAVGAAAVSLAEGAIRDMSTHKLRHALFLAVSVLALGTGVGALAYSDNDKARPKQPVAAAKDKDQPKAQAEPPARARTFKSSLPFAVFQLVPGESPRLLGLTGQANAKAINVPAGAVWYVQPMAGGFGFGGVGGGFAGGGGQNLGVGGGAVGFAGGAGMAGGGGFAGAQIGGGGGFGGGRLGQFGNIGGQAGGGARGKPPAKGKPAFAWGQKLTGASLKSLVAEVKKQNVPGLGLAAMTIDADDVAALAKGVPGLQTLVCEGTTIDDKGLAKLSGFTKLRLLRLEETAVTTEGLKALKDVKSLTRLDLLGSKFDNKSLEALTEVKGLTWLRLAQTDADGDGLKALKSLPGLTTLELCGGLTDTDVKALKHLAGLKALRLHQTAITDEGLGHLKDLKKLETLAIDAHWTLHGIQPSMGGGFGPGGVALPMKWFVPKQTFQGGKVVTLPAPQFTAKGLGELAGLAKLTELYVSNEKLGDDDLATLAKFTGLKKLTVFAPEVTDAGIAKLKGLKKVEALDLRGTAMTTGAAATLKAMPGLKVLRSNLVPMDPKFKAKQTEWKRLLPRVTVEPAFPQMVGGGFGGGGFGGAGGFGGGGFGRAGK